MNNKIHIQDDEDQEPGEDLSSDENIVLKSQPDGETSPTSSDDETTRRLEEAEQRAKENYDRLLRVSADFDNYKKRIAREMNDVVKYAHETLARELLTVVDNLERAVDSAAGECGVDDPLVKGVALTLNDVLKLLDRHHVKPIKSLGEPFDPALHQAMMQEISEDQPPNTIVKELQKGYLIHERLLRPALVAVSSVAANQPESKD